MNIHLIAQIETLVSDRPQRQLWQHRLSGPSPLIPNTRVDVRVGRRDAGDLGSFPAEVKPFALTAIVHAYPEESQRNRPGRIRTDLTDDEAEAWARVAFGEILSDYAYQLDIQIPDRLRRQIPPHQKWFVVVVDDHDEPMLAPDNFHWGLIFYTRSEPRKLHATNDSVRARLARSGPYMDTAAFRDPRTDPDGGWTIDVIGDTQCLTPVARNAVESARRIFRRRGAVTTDFRTVRLVVAGTTLQLHFRWKKKPNTFSTTVRIPQSDDDFASPPFHTPSAWMSTTAQELTEEFDTGYMVRAKRTTMDGVVHLGNADRGGGTEYYLRGDIEAPLRLHLQRGGECVAQAATSMGSDDVAVLEQLDAPPGIPAAELRRLAWVAVNIAADAGARNIVTHLDQPLLEDLGFEPDGRGRFVFDVVCRT